MILYFKMATLAPCGVQKGMVEGSTECGMGERLWFLVSGRPQFKFWL